MYAIEVLAPSPAIGDVYARWQQAVDESLRRVYADAKIVEVKWGSLAAVLAHERASTLELLR